MIMARVAKTTPAIVGKVNPFVDGIIKGFTTLEEISKGTNSNGKEFVRIPGFGVTYMRLDQIKTGVKYGVVQFAGNNGNEGALALNKISGKDELKYYMKEFPESSMTEVKELFGIIL